eukprot:1696402-Rhodomonas_salina.1
MREPPAPEARPPADSERLGTRNLDRAREEQEWEGGTRNPRPTGPRRRRAGGASRVHSQSGPQVAAGPESQAAAASESPKWACLIARLRVGGRLELESGGRGDAEAQAGSVPVTVFAACQCLAGLIQAGSESESEVHSSASLHSFVRGSVLRQGSGLRSLRLRLEKPQAQA